MDDAEKMRREKLVKYIKANNPLFMFAFFDSYSMEQLEKIKRLIDEKTQTEHKRKISVHLN